MLSALSTEKGDHSERLFVQDYRSCQESPRSKIIAWKKRARAKSIGSAGDRTFPSVSGARSGRTTAQQAQHGNIFRTITHARALIAGATTAWEDPAIVTK